MAPSTATGSPSRPSPPPPPPAADPEPPHAVFEVVHVLTSFHKNHERMKLFRVSLSVIRFLSVLNLIYTLLGITFLVMALCTNLTPGFSEFQRNQFYRIGLTVSVFAPLASVVDLFALRGLQVWKRSFLLPWLALYGFLLLLIACHALTGVIHHGFKWTYFVLILCSFCLYSSWRHIFRQYYDMVHERPTCTTIEALASELNQQQILASGTAVAPENDLPPKYEDLGGAAPAASAYAVEDEEQPPVYDEGMAAGAAAAATSESLEGVGAKKS